ncbi:MAG TPA: NAD(P)H-dependent oxidoreductase [Deinococcales bacterium]|nr:NAD(P)H-dependent oxidoreductase [Deinococcales bacterium]
MSGVTLDILAISGSLRRASLNSGLVRAAQEVAPEGIRITSFDLTPVPFYDADREAEGVPGPVADLRARIAVADAILIATPEYNYSVPGVLKNALDWASRPPRQSPLTAKPLAMMGAGGMLGTVRAQMHLRQILLHNDVRVLSKPEVYVARGWEKFDRDGNLTDESTREQVRVLVQALAAWTRHLQVGEAPTVGA